MSRCTAAERSRARRCAGVLRPFPSVIAVDVLAPADDPTDRWTLDIVLGPRADGVPPAVLDELGAFQATLRSAAPQGDGWQALATV